MRLQPDIEACIAAQRAILEKGGYWNCLAAATAIAGLLLRHGRCPWIGRLRKHELRDGAQIHWPLIPLGLAVGRAWTTHYVCVADAIVFDPVGGEPLPLADYAQRVFGEDVPIDVHISQNELVAYLATANAAGKAI